MQDFKRLLKYLRPHWLTFVFAIIAMLLGGFFESAMLDLLAPIFNQFFNPDSTHQTATIYNLQRFIPQNDWFGAWLAISAMLIFFTVGNGIAEFLSSYLMAKIGQAAILQMRRELYEHVLGQSANFFERHRTNFFVSRLVASAAAIETAVSINIRDLFRESILLVIFLGVAFYYSWRLMLGALLIVPIIAFLTAKISKRLRRFSEESFEGNKLLTDTAQESLANHTIVKAYRAEEHEKRRFIEVAARIAKANRRSARLAALSPGVISFISSIFIVVLLFFGYREINLGNMQAAQFFAFIFALFRSYEPMRRLSRQHNELSKAFAAARDVWNVMDENDKLPEKPDATELKPLRNKIELKNVSFNYQSADKTILQNINLEIPKGAMVALVGESGGGKTSLIKLVQRLYDPTEGAIFWDGIDLRDARLASLRKQTALVTQETVLFNDTVRYNISYGKPDASIEEIEQAARVAFAHDFIKELPQNYDTLVGERGIFLSGGQRQRIAIARAVLVNAPVLILDEATSALDTESERLVQKALANLMENRTSIVIAHRLSTIRKADKIVVMERGRIVETGTHIELLEKGGVYKKLYELQFLEDETSEQLAVGGEQNLLTDH
jgi:ATP-binding cassette, subfamily B, bacterial MsbA